MDYFLYWFMLPISTLVFHGDTVVKNLPAKAEDTDTQFQSLGGEDPVE